MLRVGIKRIAVVAGVAAVLLAGCTGVPDHIIQPEKMARLMADLNIAESAVDMNSRDFYSDSSRQVVKQAVMQRYDVSQDLLDTSFMWYGAHLDKFMDVYDRSTEIIEKKIEENGAVLASQSALSVSGDSVDVWSSSRQILFTPLSSSCSVSFHYDADANWERGDSYTWRAKFIGNSGNASWLFVASYSDGATEVLSTNFNDSGWQEMNFITDSTRTVKSLYGLLQVEPRNNAIYLDSVEMIRKRVNPEKYTQRYRQKLYERKKPKTE